MIRSHFRGKCTGTRPLLKKVSSSFSAFPESRIHSRLSCWEVGAGLCQGGCPFLTHSDPTTVSKHFSCVGLTVLQLCKTLQKNLLILNDRSSDWIYLRYYRYLSSGQLNWQTQPRKPSASNAQTPPNRHVVSSHQSSRHVCKQASLFAKTIL